MLRHTFIGCWIATFVLACGCSVHGPSERTADVPRLSVRQETPVDQPPAKAKVIARWTLVLGGDSRIGALPIVTVVDDGRVRVSPSLFDGAEWDPPYIEGRLTADQLELFRIGLSKVTDGLAGQEIERAIGHHSHHHRFVIDLPGAERMTFESSFRINELGRRNPTRVYWTARKGWNQDPALSRFEKLSQNYEPSEMAVRETFIAVEAELLRAAAQAMANLAMDRSPQSRPTEIPSKGPPPE